jgi:hypothetical protein
VVEVLRGPGFSMTELVAIGLFAANYAFVAPVSAILCVIGLVTRKRRVPTFLLPVAALNILVAGAQLALISDAEWWFRALLVAQVAISAAILVWIVRARA